MSIPQIPLATAAPDALAAGVGIDQLANLREVEQQVALGHDLSERSQFVEAEACFRRAIALSPCHALAHNNLGWTLQKQGDSDRAAAFYQRALQLDPRLRIARRNLAVLLVGLGRRDESFHLWREEMLAGAEGLAWMESLIVQSLPARDLTLAGEYAAILAELRWGSAWYPKRRDPSVLPLPIQAPALTLTIPKMLHDIAQFEYLQSHGRWARNSRRLSRIIAA